MNCDILNRITRTLQINNETLFKLEFYDPFLHVH